MKRIEIPDYELARRSDVYMAIQQKGTHSPQMVIDIIRDHPETNGGDKTYYMVNLVLFALQNDNENVAKYLIKDFINEFDMSQMIYKCIMQEVDTVFVDDLFDNWKVNPETDKQKPNAIILQSIKMLNKEYWDILLDKDELFELVTDEEIKILFTSFSKNMMYAYHLKWKQALDKFSTLNDKMINFATTDDKALEKFYPDAKDLFVF